MLDQAEIARTAKRMRWRARGAIWIQHAKQKAKAPALGQGFCGSFDCFVRLELQTERALQDTSSKVTAGRNHCLCDGTEGHTAGLGNICAI